MDFPSRNFICDSLANHCVVDNDICVNCPYYVSVKKRTKFDLLYELSRLDARSYIPYTMYEDVYSKKEVMQLYFDVVSHYYESL